MQATESIRYNLLRGPWYPEFRTCPKRWEAAAGQVAGDAPRFVMQGAKSRNPGPAYRFAPPPVSAAIRWAVAASGRVESIFSAWFNCTVPRG